MDTDKVLEQLNSDCDFSEAHWAQQITTFEGTRKGQQVRVQILDRGAASHTARYLVSANDNRGRSAPSNAQDPLEVAIGLTHWHLLESEPRDRTAEDLLEDIDLGD